MSDMFAALMKHKKKGKIDPNEMKSKMGVLKDIHDMATNDLGHEIKGLKKVSVMSDSDEGIQEGLKKAGEMAAHKQGFSNSDKDADDVSNDMHAESRRHKLDKHSEMSDEDDDMADPKGEERHDSHKAMEGYANGGEVADEEGAEHQHDQSHEFMEDGAATMKKEWDPYAYAKGGVVGDATDVERQSMQHNNAFGGAQSTMSKERGSAMPHLMGSGKDEHNNRPMADQNVDDYGDLDDGEIEALIKHLMAKRKG